MPAIRALHNGGGYILTQIPNSQHSMVNILLINGSIKRYPWLGFICEVGTTFMPEGFHAKMIAMEVTDGDGFYEGEWTKVEKNQFVLCWRVLHKFNGSIQWGIYGIVNKSGMPIVMTNKNNPPPAKPGADILFFNRTKKRPAKIQPNKSA